MAGRDRVEKAPRATMLERGGLRLHLFPPTPALAPYITVYYRTEVLGAETIEDWLPPEWANLRAGRGAVYEAAIGDNAMTRVPEAILSGPTSKVTRLRIGGDYDSWGVGLLPLGLATFFGVAASDIANRFENLADFPKLQAFQQLLTDLMEEPGAHDANIARLDRNFTELLDRSPSASGTIIAIHRALLSEREVTVASMAANVSVSPRTLERHCLRYFGFSPQLLLRRQRFLRSLAKYMVDPSMKWIASLDTRYHDQAHFLRDFRCFLGMKPSEYAAMDHPIAITAARARQEALGVAMQVLHEPA